MTVFSDIFRSVAWCGLSDSGHGGSCEQHLYFTH